MFIASGCKSSAEDTAVKTSTPLPLPRSVKANDDSNEWREGGDVMTKRLIIWVVSLVMFTLTATACGTVTGAAVGAAGGAAVGAGTGYGAGKGALIGTGVGAVAGAIYDIYKK
jgi:ABC-type microcin C transport system permease subunit YejE